ncbi:hypothetical protein AB0L86_19150 [Micromonospora musae]|uniref:hypothetical protein n=1 Tax=Micromonospora musae TaxID=1894970 RepID=UPI003420033B
MDPRRIELNRRHSREMGVLFSTFLDAHPDVESEVDGAQLTAEQDAAWVAFSAPLLARHQAERSALADVLEAERRGDDPRSGARRQESTADRPSLLAAEPRVRMLSGVTAPSPGTANPVPPNGPRASVILVIGGDGPAPLRPAWMLIGPALTALLGVYLLAVTFGPGGSAMRMALQLPDSAIPWSFVAYLLPALLATPLGFLLGRRWPTAVTLPAAVLLILGSLLTTLAPGSGSLLFGRALTGIAAGVAWGVTAVLVAQLRAQRAWAMPLVVGAAVLALGFGAVAGALLTRGLTWRTPFLLAVPLEVVAVLATAVTGIVVLTRRPSGSAQPPAAPLV